MPDPLDDYLEAAPTVDPLDDYMDAVKPRPAAASTAGLTPDEQEKLRLAQSMGFLRTPEQEAASVPQFRFGDDTPAVKGWTHDLRAGTVAPELSAQSSAEELENREYAYTKRTAGQDLGGALPMLYKTDEQGNVAPRAGTRAVKTGLETAINVLDTPHRIIRTGVRDPSKIGEGITNPDIPEAAPFTPIQGDSWQAFIGNLVTNLATDPTTLLAGLSTTKVGKALASTLAKQIVQITKGATKAEAIAAIVSDVAKVGGKITPELAEKALTQGLSFSEQLATGQRALLGVETPFFLKPFGVPEKSFTLIGPAAAKPVAAIEQGVALAGEALHALKPIAPIVEHAKKFTDMFRVGSGLPTLDRMMELRQIKGSMTADDIMLPVAKAMDVARKAGVSEEHMAWAERIVQSRVPNEHLRKVAEATGRSEDDIVDIFKERFKTSDVDREMSAAGLSDKQATALGALADNLERAYRDIRNIEKASLVEAEELGAGALKWLKQERDGVVRLLEAEGVPGRFIYGPYGEARNLHELFKAAPHLLKDASLKAAYESFTDMERIVSQVPGYVYNRVSREVMPQLVNFAKNDPNKWRAMLDSGGNFFTKKDADAWIKAYGTPALAGGTPKGKITAKEMAQVFFREGEPGFNLPDMYRRLKESQGRAGKFFEAHPGIALADRLEYLAKVTDRKKFADNIKDIFGAPLPEKHIKLLAEREALRIELRALDAQAGRALPGQGNLWEGQAARVTQKDYAIAKQAQDAEVKIAALDKQIQRAMHHGPEGLPKGYTLGSKALPNAFDEANDFLLPEGVARAMLRQEELLSKPETYGTVFNALRGFNQAFKTLALSNPGYLSRNKLGNVTLRLQMGGWDKLSALDDAKILRMQYAAHKASPGLADAAARDFVFAIGNGQTIRGDQLIRQAKEFGAIDSGFWGYEFKNAIRQSLEGKRGIVGKAGQFGRDTAAAIENGDKLGHMLARMRAGDSVEQAAVSANQALFNYRTVSPAIQYLRKTGMAPFAAFAAKNIPLQLEMLVKKPGQFMMLVHAKRAWENAADTEREKLPTYLRQRFGIVIGKDKQGRPWFETLEGKIPLADIPTIMRPGEFATNLFGPVGRFASEEAFGRKLATGEEIKKDFLRIPGVDAPVQVPGGPRAVHALETLIPHATGLIEDASDWEKGVPDAGRRLRGYFTPNPFNPRPVPSLQSDRRHFLASETRDERGDVAYYEKQLYIAKRQNRPEVTKYYQQRLNELRRTARDAKLRAAIP